MDFELFSFSIENSTEFHYEKRMSRTFSQIVSRWFFGSNFRFVFSTSRSIGRRRFNEWRICRIFSSFNTSTRSLRSDETVRRSFSFWRKTFFSFRNVRHGDESSMEQISMDQNELFTFLRNVQQVKSNRMTTWRKTNLRFRWEKFDVLNKLKKSSKISNSIQCGKVEANWVSTVFVRCFFPKNSI